LSHIWKKETGKMVLLAKVLKFYRQKKGKIIRQSSCSFYVIFFHWQARRLKLASLYPPQLCCRGVYWFHHVRPSVCRPILCRTITWVVFLRMFWNFMTSLPVKRGRSLSFLTIFSFVVPELLDLIWRKIGFLPYVVW
jgi:hypothetical protein